MVFELDHGNTSAATLTHALPGLIDDSKVFGVPPHINLAYFDPGHVTILQIFLQERRSWSEQLTSIPQFCHLL
jgi:hypothetical protein